MITRLIYLLLFAAPQVLLYLYLRERLPDPTRPRQARRVRRALAALFAICNLPWVVVAARVLSGSVWGVGRVPYLGPWIAWQILAWIFCGLVAVYVIGKAVWWTGAQTVGRIVRGQAARPPDRQTALLSRRRFLARATYTYAGLGAALSTHGIWSAYRLPGVTRRTLAFPDLPPGLDGLTLLHLSDLHAGIHLGESQMREIVAQVTLLRPDLIVQTGDMIDISPSYIPPYVRAFRHSHTPAAPNSRLGIHAANVGGRAPPWPTAFDSWNIRRSTKVVARHTATPHAVPLLGVEIASGAPNSAMMMQANGTDSLSACSTRSFLVSEPERASAST